MRVRRCVRASTPSSRRLIVRWQVEQSIALGAECVAGLDRLYCRYRLALCCGLITPLDIAQRDGQLLEPMRQLARPVNP
jgi:hypothetical protein